MASEWDKYSVDNYKESSSSEWDKYAVPQENEQSEEAPQSQQQPQRLQNLPFLQDWAQSLEKHPGLKKLLGGVSRVAEPIVNTAEALRVPEIGAAILNAPISFVKSLQSPMPKDINALESANELLNPQNYIRKDLLSQGAFIGTEFLVPGLGVGKGISQVIEKSPYRSKNILKKVLENESKYESQYFNKYEKLMKDALTAKAPKIEFPKNGTNKLQRDFNFIKKYESENFLGELHGFELNPTVKNAHEAKSSIGKALGRYKSREIKRGLDPHEDDVVKALKRSYHGLEKSIKDSLSKSKNPSLANEYEKTTEGYKNDVIPYSKLPALIKYKQGDLKPGRFASKLNKEESDHFMIKKEKEHPEIAKRELLKKLGIGGTATGTAGLALYKYLFGGHD